MYDIASIRESNPIFDCPHPLLICSLSCVSINQNHQNIIIQWNLRQNYHLTMNIFSTTIVLLLSMSNMAMSATAKESDIPNGTYPKHRTANTKEYTFAEDSGSKCTTSLQKELVGAAVWPARVIQALVDAVPMNRVTATWQVVTIARKLPLA